MGVLPLLHTVLLCCMITAVRLIKHREHVEFNALQNLWVFASGAQLLHAIRCSLHLPFTTGVHPHLLLCMALQSCRHATTMLSLHAPLNHLNTAACCRPAADDFIEDDAGEGEYMDTGEDELFGSAAPDEAAAAGGKGKKRKGADKGAQRRHSAAAAAAGEAALGACWAARRDTCRMGVMRAGWRG